MTTTETLEITLMKSLLKNAGINIKGDIAKSLTDKRIIGFFCLASSEIRKPATLRNLQQFVSDSDLPLVIEDCEHTHFKIMITEQEIQPAPASPLSETKFNLSLASNYLSMVEVCELNIKKCNDVDWWQEKRIECIKRFKTIFKIYLKLVQQ